MRVWIVLVLLGYSLIPLVANEPSFYVTEHVLEGRNASVECNAKVASDMEVYWVKGRSDVPYQTGLKLEFIEINRNDSGNYSCHSINTTNPEQNRTVETVMIDVQYEAEIVQFSVEPIILMENNTVTVICEMVGNPNPLWEIRNNRTHDVIFSTNVTTRTIANNTARCGENGLYICTGSNELNHGTNVTRGQNVTVLCAPRPYPFIPGSGVTFSPLGIQALLFGNTIGYPIPTFNWSRTDGRPMGEVVEYNYSSTAVLKIPSIKWSDYGNYTLTMTNIYGSSTYVCQLVPYGPPAVPVNLDYYNITNNSVTLHWTSGYDMDGVLYFEVKRWLGNQWTQISPLFTHDYKDHGVGQNWTYVLSGLRGDTSYTIAVAAKSKDFVSSESNSIMFKTTGVPDTPSHHGRLSDQVIAVVASTVTAGVFVFAVLFISLFLWYRKRRSVRLDNSRLLRK